MIKKKRLYFNIAAILILMSLLITSAYAWFYIGDDIFGIKYSIMKINSTVSSYKANDKNLNGVPDLLGSPTAQGYYSEKYDFTQIDKDVFAFMEDTGTNALTSIDLQNVLPSQIHTFKYSLENKTSVANRIKFILSGDDTFSNENLLSTISLKLGYVEHNPDKTTQSVKFGEKLFLCDYISGNKLKSHVEIPAYQPEIYVNGMTIDLDGSNCGDFWLLIEMEPYDELMKIESFKAKNMDIAAYNALQNQSVYIPTIYIYFEVIS